MKATNSTYLRLIYATVAITCITITICISCKTEPTVPSVPTPITDSIETIPAEIPPEEQAKKVETPVDFAQLLNNLLEKGDLDGALALFDAIPQKIIGNEDLQQLHVSLYISAGQFAEAESLIAELEPLYPGNSDILFLKAVLANARGDSKTYETSLKKVLSANPNHTSALSEMGLLMYSNRNWSKSGEYFAKCLTLTPNDPTALYGLARVQYRTGKYDDAEETLKRTLEVDPVNHLAWADLAKIKYENNRIEAAIQDIYKAIAICPSESYYYYDLGRFEYKQKHQDAAQNAFSKAIELNPDYYLSYVYRAGLRDVAGDFTGAEADYRIITKQNPDYYFANESLAVLLWRRQQWAECRMNFAAALAHRTDNYSYILMMCACLQREGNQREIKALLKGVLPYMDHNSLEYFVMRLYNDNAGENDVFLKLQKEKSAEKKSKALFYVASYYETRGKIALAQKYYQEAKDTILQPSFFEYRLIDWAVQNIAVQS